MDFRLDRRLKLGYYSRGEGRGTRKGKRLERINPWRVVHFFPEIFFAQGPDIMCT